MTVNLAALAPITTAATALSGLILVSPQNVKGYQPQDPATGTISTNPLDTPLIFNFEGDNTGSFASDITDHYVEDNTAVTDHIALKPEMISVEGFVGELNTVAPIGLQTAQYAAEKLTAIGSYAPTVSNTASLAYANAFYLYQVAASLASSATQTLSTFGAFGGGLSVVNSNNISQATISQTDQQKMFVQIYGYWRNRRLFTIQTPWAIFENMAIDTWQVVQDAETNVISDFKLNFKMIRVAQTSSSGLVGAFGNTISSGRAAAQQSDTTNLGNTTPNGSDGTTMAGTLGIAA